MVLDGLFYQLGGVCNVRTITSILLSLCMKLLSFVAGWPPTPMSPFKPHDVAFPSAALSFSVQMKRGFAVLTKTKDPASSEVCTV